MRTFSRRAFGCEFVAERGALKDFFHPLLSFTPRIL